MKISRDKIIELIWVIIVLSFFVISLKLIRGGNLDEQVLKFGLFAPIIIVVLKMTTLIIAPLGGTPLYIMAGAIFGTFKGFLLCILGDILGSISCFFIGRKYGKKIVRYFTGETLFLKVEKSINILSDVKSFTKARIGFITMPEVLAYATGLSKINFWKFIFIHTLLYIPVDFILVYFGKSLIDFGGIYIFLYPLLFIAISATTFYLLSKDYAKTQGM